MAGGGVGFCSCPWKTQIMEWKADFFFKKSLVPYKFILNRRNQDQKKNKMILKGLLASKVARILSECLTNVATQKITWLILTIESICGVLG